MCNFVVWNILEVKNIGNCEEEVSVQYIVYRKEEERERERERERGREKEREKEKEKEKERERKRKRKREKEKERESWGSTCFLCYPAISNPHSPLLKD